MNVPRVAAWTAATLLLGSATGPGATMMAADPGDPVERAPQPLSSPPIVFDPSQFGGPIDNPWMPMSPGSRWVYRETEGDGSRTRVEVTVTTDTRDILGISATVIHDVAKQGGETVEDTWDWYAQDLAGNVWYLGEDTTAYEKGKVVSREGSWEAGVDGAQAGIVMLADPTLGMAYLQEDYPGHAEDAARVLSLDEWVDVPFGSFEDLLMTREYTALATDLEYKFHARGVGMVLAVTVAGGFSREELIEFVPGG